MPQEEKLLTTGQFARAARTTKETLFHYDRIGLFHPVKVGETAIGTTPRGSSACSRIFRIYSA